MKGLKKYIKLELEKNYMSIAEQKDIDKIVKLIKRDNDFSILNIDLTIENYVNSL